MKHCGKGVLGREAPLYWLNFPISYICKLSSCILLSEESRSVLSRFSKNYLPILFNLYTDSEGKADHKSTLMSCIKAYFSISGKTGGLLPSAANVTRIDQWLISIFDDLLRYHNHCVYSVYVSIHGQAL